MSDPPFPLSPYAPSPASPSPQAANPRNFWRDIVRRGSRPTSTIPSDPSSPSPDPLDSQLIEINTPNPQQTDAVRRHVNHPVNASAFHDLPPVQVYDPAWNINPLRCEAGRLGPQTSGPNTPVLPGAFTIKSSDLEDDDDDDTDYDPSHCSTTPTCVDPSPQPPPNLATSDTVPVLAPEPDQSREADRPMRPRRSIMWRKQNPVTIAVKTTSAVTKPRVFESPTSFKNTCEALKHVLQNHLKGEIISVKACDIRTRVPIRSKDNIQAAHIVVISIDDRQNACRISIRRSFADSFRISTEDFDKFCIELQECFRDLQQFTRG